MAVTSLTMQRLALDLEINLLTSLCSSIFAIPIFPETAVSCAVSKQNKEGLSANITNPSVRGDDVLDCDVAHHRHVSARLFPFLPFTSESLGASCFASHRRSDVLIEVSVSVSVSVSVAVSVSVSARGKFHAVILQEASDHVPHISDQFIAYHQQHGPRYLAQQGHL